MFRTPDAGVSPRERAIGGILLAVFVAFTSATAIEVSTISASLPFLSHPATGLWFGGVLWVMMLSYVGAGTALVSFGLFGGSAACFRLGVLTAATAAICVAALIAPVLSEQALADRACRYRALAAEQVEKLAREKADWIARFEMDYRVAKPQTEHLRQVDTRDLRDLYLRDLIGSRAFRDEWGHRYDLYRMVHRDARGLGPPADDGHD